MKLTNTKLLLTSLGTTILFNAFVLYGFNPFFLGSIFSSIYLLSIPGFHIKKLLKIQNITYFESLIYIVGLSVSYLLLIGITINSLSLLQVTSRPLTLINSLIIFNASMIILFLISQFKNNKPINLPHFHTTSYLHLFFYLIPFLFPLLSIGGVQILNNQGTNILTMILLGSIASYVLLAAFFMKKLNEFHFELPIYLIGIALLFMFSLRSSDIIGWDIYQEYKVFLLTQSNQLWSMKNYQDAYNACLSITILPTIFHYFTKIYNPYIFKILYQAIFALVPVTIYSFAKKFTTPFIAFLSVFFFMSTVNFSLEMPALVRQEIAFLFFGLLLSVLLNKELLGFQKRILFILFSFSVVLSHYSTAYILIGLFGFGSIGLLIYKRFFHKSHNYSLRDFDLEPVPVVIFILFSFFWLGIITKTSSNFIYTITNTLNNINDRNRQTFNTSLIDQLLLAPRGENEQELLRITLNEASKEYKYSNFIYYPSETFASYRPAITHTDMLPLHVSKNTSNFISIIGSTLLKIIKASIFVGFIGVIILFRKKFFPAEYGILSIGFAIALIILTCVPAISFFYPIGRLDQQALFLIGLPTILSLSWLLRFIPIWSRYILITILFVTYFLYSTTFIPQLVGGNSPEIFLNNSGRYYNEIYLHAGEVRSIQWLYANNENHAPVFADLGSSEKIKVFSGETYPNVYTRVVPSLIDKNAYVYSNYANTLHNIGIIDIKVERMEYNFPSEFLNNNKNLIYSNGSSRIFK